MSNHSVQKMLAAKRQALSEIESEIGGHQAQIEALEVRAVEMRAEIRGMEAVFEAMGTVATEGRPVRAGRKARKGASRSWLSDRWKKVLQGVIELEQAHVSLEDFTLVCEDQGVTGNAETIRSQVSGLVARGYLHRVRPGVFRLTDLGKEAASSLSQKVEPPGASTPSGSDSSSGAGKEQSKGSSAERSLPSASKSYRQDLLNGAANLAVSTSSTFGRR